MNNRDLVLLEALKKRLAEVEPLIKNNNFEGDENSNAEEHYAEEYLRKFMVSVFPKVKEAGQNYKNLNVFFDLLDYLYAFTFYEDLRFLDAYNNAFEIISSLQKIDDTKTQVFFNKYKATLLHHINLLEK